MVVSASLQTPALNAGYLRGIYECVCVRVLACICVFLRIGRTLSESTLELSPAARFRFPWLYCHSFTVTRKADNRQNKYRSFNLITPINPHQN